MDVKIWIIVFGTVKSCNLVDGYQCIVKNIASNLKKEPIVSPENLVTTFMTARCHK
jgi:hypothetical protein